MSRKRPGSLRAGDIPDDSLIEALAQGRGMVYRKYAVLDGHSAEIVTTALVALQVKYEGRYENTTIDELVNYVYHLRERKPELKDKVYICKKEPRCPSAAPVPDKPAQVQANVLKGAETLASHAGASAQNDAQFAVLINGIVSKAIAPLQAQQGRIEGSMNAASELMLECFGRIEAHMSGGGPAGAVAPTTPVPPAPPASAGAVPEPADIATEQDVVGPFDALHDHATLRAWREHLRVACKAQRASGEKVVVGVFGGKAHEYRSKVESLKDMLGVDDLHSIDMQDNWSGQRAQQEALRISKKRMNFVVIVDGWNSTAAIKAAVARAKAVEIPYAQVDRLGDTLEMVQKFCTTGKIDLSAARGRLASAELGSEASRTAA